MLKRVDRYFIAGLLIIVPLFLSVYIFYVLFRFVDGILGNFIDSYFQRTFGFYVPGIGLILFLVGIIFVGFISSHVLGKRFHNFLGRTVTRFPLLRYIYPLIKQAFEFLFSGDQLAFKKAVLVEYPCKGTWSIGFITNESFHEAREKTRQELLNVFIPLAPNPVSGFIALVPHKEVIQLDISIQEAMKLIISAGLINPHMPARPATKE